MTLLERYFFRQKDEEKIKRVLVGRACKLYLCLPERDLKNNISWGEGKVPLSKELLNLLDGKTRQEKRRVRFTVCAIGRRRAFNADLTVELNGRAMEFSINCNHEIQINRRTKNGREKHNTAEPWKLLEQAIKVGENLVALSD